MPHSISPTQDQIHIQNDVPPKQVANQQDQPPIPTLHVNDGILSNPGHLIPSSPTEPLDVLRARYDRDGYVFLKGLLPRDDVLKARSSYFTFLSPTGVLAPDTAPVDGIFDSSKPISNFPGIGAGAVGGNGRPGGDDASAFVDLALAAHTEPWYAEDFCKHPKLKEFVAYFTGWGGDHTKAIRRTLLRNNIPGTHAIGVHYDQIFLRHGEPTAVTAWVPIGDVAIDGGGLIYLEGGHRLGEEQEAAFTSLAQIKGLSDEETKNGFNANMMDTGMLDNGPKHFGEQMGCRWLAAEYEAGDVVLHSPFSVHASTVNHDVNGRIRLATDLRFVDCSRKWDTRWDKHYEIGDGL